MGHNLTEPQLGDAAVSVDVRVSPGGITYWLVSDDTIPLVAMRFGFRGTGAVRDPEGKDGTANLLSGVMDEGAGPHDSIAFQTLLEDNAIRLGFDASHDTMTGELTILSDTVELSTELLALTLNAPRFDSDAIERTRAQIVAGLRRDLHDPENMASRLSSRTFFPGHPYARSAQGTVESVPTITRDDLAAHHAAAFARDRLKVAIVGDIAPEHADRLVDRAFGDLPQTANLPAIADFTIPNGVQATDAQDIAQTVIRFALPGLHRTDPDYLTAHVMNHIFGGGTFSSRLFKQVRQERGLTYSVYSFLAAREHAPLLLGGASTRPERAQETLDVIRQVIAEFLEDGPTGDELDQAKDFLIGSYPLRFDSSQKIAQQLVGMQLEDMPVSYMSGRADLIRAIAVDDIRRVAERLLRAPLSTAIVGRPLT